MLYTSFFCITTIELFWPARLCHLTFFTLTHTAWHSGALYTWFLPFVTSASAICLCPALAQVIFVYVTTTFFTVVHAISFCWVSIGYVSFSHDSRCSLSLLLGTSKCYLSLVALASPYIIWFLWFRLTGQAKSRNLPQKSLLAKVTTVSVQIASTSGVEMHTWQF